MRFDYEKYDFWKIYDTIKQFYPIGIKKDDMDMYLSYPGIKELERILVENIHDHNSFAKWEEFTRKMDNGQLIHPQNNIWKSPQNKMIYSTYLKLL